MRKKASNFKIERIKANYSIMELSEYLKVTYRRVQNLEHSENLMSYITYSELRDLAKLYEMTIDELVSKLEN